MGLTSGQLFANSTGYEHEIPFDEINGTIESALKKANDKGLSGGSVTPFISRYI